MVVCDDPPFVFLHVPRTGGSSAALAIKKAFPQAIIYNQTSALTHMGAVEAADNYGCDRVYLTIMRSPWELTASLYSLFAHWAAAPKQPNWWGGDEPHAAAQLSKLSFAEFVQRTTELQLYRPPGGWSVKYCPQYVHVFQFGHKPYDGIGQLLGKSLNPPNYNGGWGHPKYDEQSVNTIASYDKCDIERFGYAP